MKLLLSLLAGAALAASSADAQEFTAYHVPAGTAGNQNFGGSLGMLFDVTTPITVTKLGVFDSGSDGLFLNLTARIYNRDTGVQMAMLAFTPADPGDLVEGSRFKALPAPIDLPAGFHGIMVGRGYGAGELLGNQGVPNPPLAPGLTTDNGGGLIEFVGIPRYGVNTDLPGTTDDGPVNRYAAGTFVFEPGGNRPATPANLKMTSGDGSLGVSWDPVIDPIAAATYKVYRSLAKTGPWTEVGTVTAPAASFADSGLTNRTEYFYQVKALDAGNVASRLSAAVSDSPFPANGGRIGWQVPWGTSGVQDYGGPLGMDFDVMNEINVTHMGIFDHASDGISSNITVRIFDRDSPEIPLAETVFSPFAPGLLHNGSRYLQLAEPVTLHRGFHGCIVAVGFNGVDRNGNVSPLPGPWTTDDGNGSLIFTGRARFGAIAFPDLFPATLDNGPANRYAAGTFEYTTTAPLFPGTPELTVQVPLDGETLVLSWPAVTGPLAAVRYDIYRSEDQANFTKVGDSTTTSFTNTGLTAATTYYYYIRAVAAGGAESFDSNIASGTAEEAVVPAAGIAYVVPENTLGTQFNFGGALGFDFDVLREADITQLGCFDSGGDGIFATISVRIYDRSMTPPLIVAEETFTEEAPGTLVGGSRFKTLAAALRLTPGFKGRLVADGYGALEPDGNDKDGLLLGLTTFDGGRTLRFIKAAYYGLAAGSYPNVPDAATVAHPYAAGTFYFVPVGTVSGPSNLRIQKLGSDLVFTWDGGGVLQESVNLTSWADLPGVTSGQDIPMGAGGTRFFRVRP